ncbi:hypothetical protein [Leifsonia sp. ALI-44-B]|uniref:hypothetical protein n=1 Tax=Leifsonia sp. ALI-44-B TaxID=1933776 RepID=UPI00117B39A2|nr:hypothetical protein [Leifsonia sp. ALI-44-B]
MLVLTAAGCGVVPQGPSFESTKADALELRSEFEEMLPAADVAAGTVKDHILPCDGSDTAQFDGVLIVSVAEDFDRTAWLDEAAAMYEDRPGWRVEKKVAADGSSDATSGVAFASEGGYYLRVDGVADTSEGGPVMVLSVSGPCSYL